MAYLGVIEAGNEGSEDINEADVVSFPSYKNEKLQDGCLRDGMSECE